MARQTSASVLLIAAACLLLVRRSALSADNAFVGF
eukprot:CAMPEP_0170638760 /NCGR_PEP_ID=MMETSP0224-20130122/39253_1 /TAXON_ID=285029 /ORGANISM="Togula jolla, Strain CCCM 725" /LENGTH=34 /DNA_ID= /DNA_START= /DNA_END= /DNA_ORIENTATION=